MPGHNTSYSCRPPFIIIKYILINAWLLAEGIYHVKDTRIEIFTIFVAFLACCTGGSLSRLAIQSELETALKTEFLNQTMQCAVREYVWLSIIHDELFALRIPGPVPSSACYPESVSGTTGISISRATSKYIERLCH